MDLREPPRATPQGPSLASIRGLLIAVLAAVLAVGAVLYLRSTTPAGGSAERHRELAAKLQAAGALDEASAHYERYLAAADLAPEAAARIAYSLGSTYLEQGRFQKALRWFYEAELWGPTELSDELGRKIVHTLERLGRHHAAQAALTERTRLDASESDDVRRSPADPVIARIGSEEIYRSEVERALDELPPELAQSIRSPADREAFARQFVAEELLWRKARKMEYDRDADVLRRHEAALRQLAVARLVEDEVVGKVEIDESDLRNFFEANRGRYQEAAGDTSEPIEFDGVRALVERDYRLGKVQSGYQALIETELSTEGVEVFTERMEDGA